MALVELTTGIYQAFSTDDLTDQLNEGDKVFFNDTEDYCCMENGELKHISKVPYKTKSGKIAYLLPQELLQNL